MGEDRFRVGVEEWGAERVGVEEWGAERVEVEQRFDQWAGWGGGGKV